MLEIGPNLLGAVKYLSFTLLIVLVAKELIGLAVRR